MTPQILLDALRKAFISLEMVCLMILDECHRATGNHPYTKIMKVNIDNDWENLFVRYSYLISLTLFLFVKILTVGYFGGSLFVLVKEFYHKSVNKPKIFGMTASPVIRKG